jgi:Zn-finger domain-containing protein
VLEIKTRIRAALRAVEGLPDVDRSLEEQKEEIRELEERITRQKEVLAGLKNVGERRVDGTG